MLHATEAPRYHRITMHGTVHGGRDGGSDGVTPKISVRGLTRRFVSRARTTVALDSVDLDIADGEFLCIVGPSGCGKTTLLRTLAGLESHDEGVVDITVANPDAVESSMVFQDHSIFPWMSVRDNVAFGLEAQGVSKRERWAAVQPYIEQVGLGGFERALPYQLSGGMKQRVSIARAFATDPEILYMDEPFAALDEQTKLVLQEQLLRIWESTRKTVVYVTHSIDEAIILADRIVVMSARPGRIKDMIDVTSVVPRPRQVEEVKASEHFGRLFSRVWEGLRHEIVQASRGDAT
jgi:NitT/TauT family transport system ATP-binding protein